MEYRKGGMKANLANEQAVSDMLTDLTAEKDSIAKQIQAVLARRQPEKAGLRQKVKGLIDTGQITKEELDTHIRDKTILQRLGVAIEGEVKETDLTASISKAKASEEYRGAHQIKLPITTADKLEYGDSGFEWQYVKETFDLTEQTYKESYNILKKIKDNPDAEVTIYRAVPKGVNTINDGDWVTLSMEYAKNATGDVNTPKIISKKVKAKEVAWDGNDLNEFAYKPDLQKTPAPEAVKPIPLELEPLAQEARKYKSAEEFLDNQEYFRNSNSVTGGRDAPWQLFSNNRERIQHYGKYEFFVDGKNAVDSTTLIPKIERILKKYPDILEEYQATAKQLANEASPGDIVDSAGIWDNLDLTQLIWDEILEPKNIMKVKTPNGIVIFDNNLIKTKSQLTDFYNQATGKVKPAAPKSTTDLVKDLNDALGEKGAIGEGEGQADISKVAPILIDIGKTVYADGHTSYVQFRNQMKETLGASYYRVRDYILKVWEMVKRFNEQMGIRGSVGGPVTLTGLIRRLGGISLIKVEKEGLAGDVRQIAGLKEGGGNLINNKTGLGLEKILEHARAEGFVAEDATLTDLLDAIDKEIRFKNVTNRFEEPVLPEQPRPNVVTGNLNLKKGDEFKIEGEKFEVKGKDKEGNLIIEDGERFVVDPVFGEIPSPDLKSIKRQGEQKEIKKEVATKETQKPETIKQRIDRITGIKNIYRMIQEDEALSAAWKKAEQNARIAFRAGDKEGVAKEKARMREILNEIKEREIYKQAIGKLKTTVGKLSESPSVSADYRNKIKDIIGQYELSGHREETIDKLEATQKYLDKAKASGEDVEIPQRILDKLKILGRNPIDPLTINQGESRVRGMRAEALKRVIGLQNEIELLGKLGKTKWASKEALYDAEKEARTNELIKTASPINSKEAARQPIGSDPKKWAERYITARNYIQKSSIGLKPIDGLADITGMQPMKAVLDLNYGNYLTYNDSNILQWYELTKDFTDKNFERIGAIAISRQAGGLERLANSGITEKEINDIKLTPKEEKAYQFVRDTFEKEFPAVKKYALDVYNADVGQVDNYVSFMTDYDAMSDLEIYDRFGARAEEAVGRRTKTVEQGFRMERAGAARNKLEFDIDKIFRRHIDDVAYMLTMGRDVKQYFEIVNSPEMRAKLGDVGTIAWLQWLDLMARKGGTEGAKRIAGVDWLRKNTGAGVLAFRLSSTLVQFTSFADTMATVGAEWATRGASSIATSTEWRNFVMDNFPEIKKAVGDDIAFREFGNGIFERMTRLGFKPLQVMDGIMRSTAAAAAYQKLAFEKGIDINLANPDKGLVQEATRLMRQSQGSSFFKDQPLAISTGYGFSDNKSINKALLQFQSFMLNHWDNMKRQIWRLGIKEKNYKKAAMSFFWIVIVAAAMEEGLRRTARGAINLLVGDDDKDKEETFTGNVALNVVQAVPILGQIVSAITYASNPVPIINAFEDLISGIGGLVKGKSIATKEKGAVRAAGAAGSLLGVPGSSQAAQIIKEAIPDKKRERR